MLPMKKGTISLHMLEAFLNVNHVSILSGVVKESGYGNIELRKQYETEARISRKEHDLP